MHYVLCVNYINENINKSYTLYIFIYRICLKIYLQYDKNYKKLIGGRRLTRHKKTQNTK